MDFEAVKSVGKELKQKRLDDNISLDEVSKQLKIRKSYIKNIENGDVENMPFEAYLIGYVRHYSDFLGLNSDEFIQQIKSSEINIKSVGSTDIITDEEFLPSISLIAITIALTIISFLFVVYY